MSESRYEKAISFDSLYTAFGHARRGSFWKDSIISYDVNRLENTLKLHRELVNNQYDLKGYYRFTIQEREKIRDIQSLHITDRVVQRSLCDNILIADYEKGFIYDNSASQKGKGTHFSRDRLKAHLQKFYRKHGIDGYILQIDIKKYFDSIPHQYLCDRADKIFKDDPEVAKELHRIANSFDGDKGIGLGSQVCQLFALDALNELDHYIKEVLGIKYYGRYMDDAYLIHEDKGYLKLCRDMINCKLSECGMELHPNKTNIMPIRKGIKFLGFHFYLTETGSVHAKLLSKSKNRIKRKLRKMIALGVDEEKVRKSFTSWKSHAMYGDSYYTVRKVEQYMNKMLKERVNNGG